MLSPISERGRDACADAGDKLNRPCPVCGNSEPLRCQHWCAVPEFEVLRCCNCETTFINKKVDDNFGFGVDQEVAEDTTLRIKAANDFKRLKERMSSAGLSDHSDLCLLDVGCGMGTFLVQAQQDGWTVSGLELSSAGAAYARDKRALTVAECSIESRTGFAAGSFDVITMFGVIEHLANPRAAVSECSRMLRSKGLLVLQTPAEDGVMRKLGRLLYWASGGHVTFHVKQLYQMGGGHSVCFNKRSIRELMSRCGFDVLAIEESTYGLPLLLMRFRGMSWLKRCVYTLGASALFGLGQILGSNHMTIYAKKGPTELGGWPEASA